MGNLIRASVKGYAVFTVLILTIFFAFIYMVADCVSRLDRDYDRQLGTRVLVGRDTLVVTSYDLGKRCFILSDASEVKSSTIFLHEEEAVINLNEVKN